VPGYFSVKVPVFPYNRFPNVDPILSPEMHSTGEVMGIDLDLGQAFLKAYAAAGLNLPKHGPVLLTVKSSDKRHIVAEARLLEALGYDLLATEGTWRALKSNGIACTRVNKVGEGRPNIVDLIKNREISLVLNTPYGMKQRRDDSSIRAAATNAGVPCITTLAGIRAVVSALTAAHRGGTEVHSLQSYHARLKAQSKTATPSDAVSSR